MSQQYPGLQPPIPQQPDSSLPPQQPQWNQQPQGQNEQSQWNQQPQQPYGQPQWNQQQPMYPPQQPMTPPPAPKKKSGSKKVFIGLGIVLVLVVASCAIISSVVNSAVKQTTAGTISTGSTPNNASTPANTTAKLGKVGDTITVDSVSCTFVTVKTLAADDYTKPKAGNQFIVVHVKIHNANTQQATYNPLDFHAKSGAGNVTDEEFAPPSSYTANNTLNSGQLDPGGTVEGDIIFQVPVGDHNAELTWQPNFFGNSTENAWKLGL